MPVRTAQRGGASLKCNSCHLSFNHRSSLSRHRRQTCGRDREARGARQKSCAQCARDKVRCSLDRPRCSRCMSKASECQYADSLWATDSSEGAQARPGHGHDHGHGHGQAFDANVFPLATPTGTFTPGNLTAISDNNEQSLDELVLPPLTTPSDGTSACWPSDIWTLGGPRSQLVYNSMELILRILRSWPGMLAQGFQFPPIFHHSQYAALYRIEDTQAALAPQLANCITITKMWHGQEAGAEQLVQDTIMRQVDALLAQFPLADEDAQLLILQVLVIYAILILSPSKGWRSAQSIDRELFARIKRTVQALVAPSTALYPENERNMDSQQLGWHAWVRFQARRRAVLALYLLHWAYSLYHGVQSFDCGELDYMPAPGAKVLWQARTEREWDWLYGRWCERWRGGGPFIQGEFTRVNKGIVLSERADRWLQEADEFGLIMMSIVNATDFPNDFTL